MAGIEQEGGAGGGGGAVTQSGTWTVQPGNTANTTAWKVDGSAVTQPVSAASLPLPTGAATDSVATGGTQQTKITDGTNVAATVVPGTAQTGNAVNVAASAWVPAALNVTSVSTTTYDAANYNWVSVQISALYTGTTPTITWQVSNDNVNFRTHPGLTEVQAGGTAGNATSTTAVGIWQGEMPFRYFRLNHTGAFTSGATVGQVVFKTVPNGKTNVNAFAFGGKSNNAAAPSTDSININPTLANAGVPTWTEGRAAMISSDLSGNVRVAPIPYPSAANVITSSSGNVANASAVGTITSAASRTAYLTGFTVSGAGATAASVITVVVSGTISASMTYDLLIPAGVTAPVYFDQKFPYPIPASAQNTSIVVTVAAFGAGNTNATVVATGFNSL